MLIYNFFFVAGNGDGNQPITRIVLFFDSKHYRPLEINVSSHLLSPIARS